MWLKFLPLLGNSIVVYSEEGYQLEYKDMVMIKVFMVFYFILSLLRIQ